MKINEEINDSSKLLNSHLCAYCRYQDDSQNLAEEVGEISNKKKVAKFMIDHSTITYVHTW